MTLLTDELRAQIGRRVSYTAPEPLGAAALRYYALALGAEAPRGGGVAPPTLICDTNQYAGLAPDADGYAGHLWDLEVPSTTLRRGGNRYEFHAPVGPDTVLTATWTLADMTETTTRAGQAMLVVTTEVRYVDQHGDPLATNTETTVLIGGPA